MLTALEVMGLSVPDQCLMPKATLYVWVRYNFSISDKWGMRTGWFRDVFLTEINTQGGLVWAAGQCSPEADVSQDPSVWW